MMWQLCPQSELCASISHLPIPIVVCLFLHVLHHRKHVLLLLRGRALVVVIVLDSISTKGFGCLLLCTCVELATYL